MELWVRSQDRDYLEKVEKIYFWESSFGKYQIESNGELGIYKTKERALEVLDEIQRYILLPNTDNSAYVYEMPKE